MSRARSPVSAGPSGPASSMASSMASRRRWELTCGSSASVSQRTTTKCRPPAAAMGPTVVGSTPPVIHTGQGERATASLT